jgi:hypothetical protein
LSIDRHFDPRRLDAHFGCRHRAVCRVVGCLSLQLAQEFFYSFLSLFRRRREIDFGPAPKVSAQGRVEKGIQFRIW